MLIKYFARVDKAAMLLKRLNGHEIVRFGIREHRAVQEASRIFAQVLEKDDNTMTCLAFESSSSISRKSIISEISVLHVLRLFSTHDASH